MRVIDWTTRWRLHGLLWLCVSTLLFLVLVTYSFLSVETVYHLPAPGTRLVYEQGWPFVYVKRITTEGASSWTVLKGVEWFHSELLLANVLVAAILAGIAAIWLRFAFPSSRTEWPRSVGAWVFLAFLGTVLAAAQQLRSREHQREAELLRELEAIGWWTFPSNSPIPWYVRPVVGLGIVPDADWGNFGIAWEPESFVVDRTADGSYHVESRPAQGVDLDINRLLKEDSARLRELAYCDEVTIADTKLTNDGIEALCTSIKHCRALTLNCSPKNVTDRALRDIVKHLPKLEELVIDGVYITREGIAYLKRLDRLTFLALGDGEGFSEAEACEIANLPSIRTLQVPETWRNYRKFCSVAQERHITVKWTATAHGADQGEGEESKADTD